MIRYSFAPLSWKHYRVCKQLFDESFDISEAPWFLKSWRNRSETQSLVACMGGVVIGVAIVDNTHTLRYLYVKKEFQNEKIGTKLLKKVIESSSEQRSLWLTTGADERLISFYSRAGFCVINKIYKNNVFIGADMVLRNRCRSAPKY